MRNRCERIPTEHMEQRTVVEWARMQGRNASRYPGLTLLFAIPNGGGRTTAEAGMLFAEGVLKGVPDLFLPVPIEPYGGLFIEMKRKKSAKLSPEQKDMIAKLRAQGYAVELCYGADEAMQAIQRYYAGQTGRRENSNA